MPGRTSPFQTSVSGMSDGSDSYRYGFNGKENDFEPKNGQGSQQDYGMRIYDPRLGKWFSIDPEFKQYPHSSPYVSFANNPIFYIDPEGETLKVAGDDAAREQVRVALQKLTNDKVVILKDGTINVIKSNENPSKKLVDGTKLLREATGHSKTTTIIVNNSVVGSGVDFEKSADASNGKGTNTTIRFSKFNGKQQVSVNGKTVDRDKDDFIVLGTEIIHSLIAMDGNSINAKMTITYKNIFGDNQNEYYQVEEFAVHGIINSDAIDTRGKRDRYVTEKDLNKEQKLPLRVAYGSSLDYSGRPENSEKVKKLQKEQQNK